MYLFRALAVWLLIVVAESVHGTLRQLFLAPLVGDLAARRISFFVAVRWIDAPTPKSLFAIGLMWMILMTVFEFGLGLFAMNYSWQRMLEDYDLSRGGLMGLGLIFMIFAPRLAAGLRNRKGANEESGRW